MSEKYERNNNEFFKTAQQMQKMLPSNNEFFETAQQMQKMLPSNNEFFETAQQMQKTQILKAYTFQDLYKQNFPNLATTPIVKDLAPVFKECDNCIDYSIRPTEKQRKLFEETIYKNVKTLEEYDAPHIKGYNVNEIFEFLDRLCSSDLFEDMKFSDWLFVFYFLGNIMHNFFIR
ncbi:MAG: hypothetical protein FWG63_01865 [Defluviitaleaceae bacterium]|nr:hypothetical protein [Defluviitaleaceae bacterium]